MANAKQLREHRADVLKLLDGHATRWFDTHPCHADRVAHVERLDAAGLFDCDLPASRLFADFRGLCRRATDAFYAGDLRGRGPGRGRGRATDELAAERAAQRAAARGAAAVLPRATSWPGGRSSRSPTASAARADVPRAAPELATARRSVEDAAAAGDALAATIRRYAEASHAPAVVQAQLSAVRAVPAQPRARAVAARAERLLAEHRPALAETAAILSPFEEAGRQRLTLALRLVRTDAVAGGLGERRPAGRATVPSCCRVCDGLEAALPAAGAAGRGAAGRPRPGGGHNPGQPLPPLVHADPHAHGRGRPAARRDDGHAGDVPYPFAHGTAGVTRGGPRRAGRARARDPTATYQAARRRWTGTTS